MILAASLLLNPLFADMRWLPGFGARWLWGISAAHLLASWLCLRNATEEYQSRIEGSRIEGHNGQIPWFWRGLAAFMFALFLNKFFDLQSLITVFLRQQSQIHGWYSSRRPLQWTCIQASFTLGVIAMLVSIYLLRGHGKKRRIAGMSAIFLLTLILCRTPSYHPLDHFLYHMPYLGNHVNAGLELGASLFVSLGAFLPHRSTSFTRAVRTSGTIDA